MPPPPTFKNFATWGLLLWGKKMRSTFAFALVERTFNKKYFLLNSLKGGGKKLSFKKVFPAKNINIINSSPRLLKTGKALYF